MEVIEIDDNEVILGYQGEIVVITEDQEEEETSQLEEFPLNQSAH